MDMTLIQSTISGLKTAEDIAKSLMELNSISDVQAGYQTSKRHSLGTKQCTFGQRRPSVYENP